MELNDIVTKSILETSKARVLELSTALLVQRQSSVKAEHTLISDLITFTANSNLMDVKIKDVVNRSIGTAITTHSNSPDPHGDRSYTNAEIVKHLNFNDPHGSNLFTTQAITNHNLAEDPHKDRLFTATSIETHSNSPDPHGDRSFTTTSLNTHKLAEDPHGDRAYAFNLLQEHKTEIDPHSHKAYTNSVMTTHKAEADPHGINAKITTAIAAHNADETAHNLNTRLASMSLALRNDLDTTITQKIGVSIAPLEFGIVPKANLPVTVVVANFASFPKTGISENAIYVDKEAKLSYIYVNNTYQPLNQGIGGGNNGGLTTDIVPAGVNLDRQYVTRALRTSINSKLENLIPTGEGYSLVSNVNTGINTKAIKTIKTEGSLTIEDRGVDLILNSGEYNFEAYYNGNTLLTTDSDILKDLEKDEQVFITGDITSKVTNETDNASIVTRYKSFRVTAAIGTKGTTTPIVAPSQLVQSSNGLVVTGTGVKDTFVEIYSAQNVLLGTSTTIETSSFSITLNTAMLDGQKLKVYTVTLEGNRSKPTIHYAHSSTAVREIDCISISMDGLTVRGKTTRGAVVDLTTNTDTPLGSATADVNGNFSITSSTALVANDTIVLIAKLGASLRTTETIVVELPIITAAYDLVINETNTVLTGKAEPTALITISTVAGEYTTSTNSSGDFSLFNYTNALGKEEYIFTVSKEARSSSITYSVGQALIITNPEPIVKDLLLTETTELLGKQINNELNYNGDALLDIIYNPITKEIEILGRVTDTSVYTRWQGLLKIKRYKR